MDQFKTVDGAASEFGVALKGGARGYLAALLVLFFLTSAAYSFVIPDWMNFDEPFHYIYVRTLFREGRLPVHPAEGAKPKPLHETDRTYQAAHPPLYYGLAAMWAMPFRHREAGFLSNWIRLLSVIMGVFTLYLIFRIGRDCLGDEWLGAGMATFAAVNPLFAATYAVISNDSAVILACTGAVYIMLRCVRDGGGVKPVVYCGVVAGLCCLVKLTANLIPVFFVAFYLSHPGNRRRGWKRVTLELALFCLTVFAVCSWWYIRGYLIIGDRALFNPVGGLEPNPLYIPANFIEFFRTTALTFSLPQEFLRGNPVGLPMSVKALYFGLSILSLALVVACLAMVPKMRNPVTRHAFWVFGVAILIHLAQMYMLNMQFQIGQGRYMFIIMGPIAALAAAPLRRLLGPRFKLGLLAVMSAGFAMHLVWILVFFRSLPPLGFPL